MIRGISFLSEAAEDDDDVIIVWLFYGEGNGANIIGRKISFDALLRKRQSWHTNIS